MNVCFRVDSSHDIGIGHLMRCLTLADELHEKNHEISFICRELSGHLISLIKYPVLILAKNNNLQSDDLYLNSLDTTQEQDAEQTIEIIPKNTDLLIIDSYALDKIWHDKLRQHTRRIIVIDDLADKQFNCDLLLNQNLGSIPNDYKGKVSNDCVLLLGCDYALLRPEFKKLRQQAVERRKSLKEIQNILVSVGGSDINNVTYEILQQLDPSFNVVVVLGARSPHNKIIEDYAVDKNIEVIVNSNNMAGLMLNADLAIGASGSTNWERLSLGLPSLVFTVAENQVRFSKILADLGLIRLLGHVDIKKKNFDVIKESILSITDLKEWSDRCFASCSCDGTSRVAIAIENNFVSTI